MEKSSSNHSISKKSLPTEDTLKCRYNGHCEININNRHVCSYCRLSKCFDCGMQTELIRCSYSKKDKTNQKSTSVADAEPVVALKN
ncbi:unnamed protein product [Rotaria magnacalcarata]|uniref:Nuclear receptor domain-containing protein n=1 Tax=Rotaria magnacalcarata TaxID=392030 RepID=A0A816YEE0_9BILA|nr:unnamed protein product [Rotaria magnacalcarata]